MSPTLHESVGINIAHKKPRLICVAPTPNEVKHLTMRRTIDVAIWVFNRMRNGSSPRAFAFAIPRFAFHLSPHSTQNPMKISSTVATVCFVLACVSPTQAIERKLILGGEIVPAGTKTYTAGIRTTATGNNACGGTLISSTHVIIASLQQQLRHSLGVRGLALYQWIYRRRADQVRIDHEPPQVRVRTISKRLRDSGTGETQFIHACKACCNLTRTIKFRWCVA